jgi:Holliday junction resolvase RusA-like endonuclease
MSDVLIEERQSFKVDAFGCSFCVYGTAQPGGSKRGFISPHGRVVITDANKLAKPWRQQVADVALVLMDGRQLYGGALALHIHFHITRPKGHYGARGLRPAAPKHPTTRPDLTKLCRPLEDALKGIVWRDDAQIVEQHIYKHYGEPARAEIKVETKF